MQSGTAGGWHVPQQAMQRATPRASLFAKVHGSPPSRAMVPTSPGRSRAPQVPYPGHDKSRTLPGRISAARLAASGVDKSYHGFGQLVAKCGRDDVQLFLRETLLSEAISILR